MEPILLAVAVHDEETLLLRAVPKRLRVQAGHPLRFRISYRLADTPGAREEASVAAILTMAGHKPMHAAIGMHDRPLLDDSRFGDLVFDVPALQPGVHHVHFAVALESSSQDLLLKDPARLEGADVQGDVELEVVG